jgi:hypothetical protein
LWQQYNQGLSAGLYPFERDVAIAQKTLQERSPEETGFVIVRGTEAQSYVRADNREGATSYTARVIATAQEKCLTPEQRDRAKFVAGVLDRLLNFVNKEDFEGERYRVRRNTNELTLEAKDGRGQIMNRKQGAIAMTQLTSEDQKSFEQFDQSLQKKQRQVQKQQTGLTPPQRTQSKGSQMEI